jgi:AAA15 family ATPase/GTPase
MDHLRKRLMLTLQDAIEGKVTIKKDEFFLANKQGNLEFSLLAEGMRKLGLLWVLIQNGTLLNGSILFWDEPEANLNPSLYGTLMDIVLQLQRMGVQIFLSTHDYVILKELDLRKRPTDKILFHSLYRDNLGSVDHKASDDYLGMHPNAIDEAFGSLYDREIQRSLGSGSK